MLWLAVLYLGSLAVMVVSSFWSVDSFTGALVKQPTGENYRTLVTAEVYRTVALRTLGVAIAAGSIFSFSLTLGDYIMVQIVGGDTQLFANIIYANVGVAGNLPLAAAATVFPIVVVLLYLAAVRRTGALENL
jgi:ABC-type spermidine/putrescine transport system permease subunit I